MPQSGIDNKERIMNWGHLSLVDYGIFTILVISILIGIWRGFAHEIMSLLSWVLAFVIAIFFSEPLTIYFKHLTSNHTLQVCFSFLVLFIVTLVICAVLTHLICRLIDVTGLTAANRLFGALFGAARGLLLVLVVVFVLSLTSAKNAKWWNHSQMVPKFAHFALQIKNQLPANLSKYFKDIPFMQTVVASNIKVAAPAHHDESYVGSTTGSRIQELK